jgi:hypothetical protein
VDNTSLDTVTLKKRIDALSQSDLAGISAAYSFSGFGEELLRLNAYSGIDKKDDCAEYSFSGWGAGVPPLPGSNQGVGQSHFVLATALPSFVKPFRTEPETDALIEHTCSEWPHVALRMSQINSRTYMMLGYILFA